MSVHELQARAEGVEIVGGGDKVEFMGDTYRVAERIGMMPLLRFANVAKAGVQSDDMEGFAAMYALIRDCIDASDWDRFEHDATVKKAEQDELLKLVTDVIEVVTARPTRRPADSSAGPQSTSPSLRERSTSPPVVVDPPEAEGWASIHDLLARSTA